ncbi:MAG: LacI family DNA-binding transcriptional regulator [Rhodobacteraceae bacterium]|nr:LacI family DNA-binding transcriptional regulator [Paracoccaceae bacterium]
MAKPTYALIAKRAQVGTSTVERVLNGRGGVREQTVEKVLKAARALDWPGRLPERHSGILRIEAILVRPETSFYARLAAAFRRIAASLDPSFQIHVMFLEENNPSVIADRIANPPLRRAGLVVSAPDHATVREALSRVTAEGLPVVQVVTQSIQGPAFVGIDNYAAGRMAGLLMSRMGDVRGTVVALCHSAVYPVHRNRIRGFSDYLAEHPREGLHFAHVSFGGDERDRSARGVREAIGAWPDLAGFYNAGGANSGVIDALRHIGRPVFFVGHELNDLTRAALQDGTADVIFDQLPEAQARRAVDLLLAQLGFLDDPVDNPPIRFATITAENI